MVQPVDTTKFTFTIMRRWKTKEKSGGKYFHLYYTGYSHQIFEGATLLEIYQQSTDEIEEDV